MWRKVVIQNEFVKLLVLCQIKSFEKLELLSNVIWKLIKSLWERGSDKPDTGWSAKDDPHKCFKAPLCEYDVYSNRGLW